MWDSLRDLCFPFFIGLAGGIVNHTYALKNGATFNLTMFLLEMLASAIVGMTAWWIAQAYGLPEGMMAASAALGGMLGTKILDYLELLIKAKLK